MGSDLGLLESRVKDLRPRTKNFFKAESTRQFMIALAIYEVGIALIKEMRNGRLG